ncbi:hypothetical protein ADIWIN_3396 [Winogradskyella psychrotolerans RS-3]|uniref:DUF2891 domain-containing protein n=1 Tax=Winogradskyella psychrotolerans RS-3 TaxID=641526 RepID=S7WVJ5_9FLAO|nr:DUF2891 domain-containing protein [Winogradskyella psychrotolerans]EPR70749.1 hypothetical protein ADIWIN_3396 [Winogradskyella psychrotolerans RS-3]
MKKQYILIVLLLVFNCRNSEDKQIASEKDVTKVEVVNVSILNLEQANRLAKLPLHCMDTEYPNKLNQTIANASDLKEPKELHPAFYGCFDWHSAVHGHWSLVSLLKQFPDLENRAEIGQKLLHNISKENIAQELLYFNSQYNESFERTYGWAWLLKLAEELHTWDSDVARRLEANLLPLTNLIVDKYVEFLPKLNYPIRVGEHPNTAFGLSFAYDYAVAVEHIELKVLIEKRARDFYEDDQDCPIEWEPSGFDFLSPCLEEAALMKRVLSMEEFKVWINDFMPELINEDFDIAVGEVSDRTDGKLVHLDGVNFSRAWSLNYIVKDLPEYKHLQNVANKHIDYSLLSIVGDSYEGGHWLGSFAIYALNSIDNE